MSRDVPPHSPGPLQALIFIEAGMIGGVPLHSVFMTGTKPSCQGPR